MRVGRNQQMVLAGALMVGLALGGFSTPPVAKATRLDIAAPPRAAPKQAGDDRPVQLPTPWDFQPKGSKPPSEFTLNQGRAIDTLRYDYPRLFSSKPDLTIFSDNVQLHDPSGKRLQGLGKYEKVFDMLRLLRRTTMQDAEITYRLVTHDDEIRVRWSAKMYLRDPAFGLTTLNIIDGVSVYELDTKGKIQTHRLENIVMSDQNERAPVSLGFLWPTPQMATPEMALPFFRTLAMAAGDDEEDARPGMPTLTLPPLRPDASSARRTSTPLASEALSGETPMQRAARERAEDAEKARRLADLRSPPKEKKKGGLFGLSGPQECETSYDCDAPMVCCDLLVASVCCNGGILVGPPPDPSLQRRAIPIPVEKDSPFPPGMGGGGGAPQYPDPF